MLTRISKRRFWAVQFAVFAVFPLVAFQLLRLSVLEESHLVDLAKRQHDLKIEIQPKRGNILDRHHKPLAMNLKIPSIYAVPRLIENKNQMTTLLAQILQLDRSFVLDRISRDKGFIWLKRQTTAEEAKAVSELKNSALGIIYESKRFYPHGDLLANVIGFCNIDNEGLEGVELAYEKYLKGRPGMRRTKRDALGREVVALGEELIPAVDGADVILTIDHYIQYLTERALDEAYIKYKAKGAMAIVMNPQTGEILAMANRPSFDLNHDKSGDPASRRNRTITDINEPGSIFKIITASAALEEKKAALADRFNCENGEWEVRRGRVIHDVHSYGLLSFAEVIQKSSNIGTVKIAQRLGEELMYKYSHLFGFGEPTGIDIPGEVSGILHPISKWSKYSMTSIPYGQEVAGTAIQMVTALSVVANGGRLVRPYVISAIQDQKGVILKKTEPATRAIILSPEVAHAMSRILEKVVSEGTGKNAQIEGVAVAGKTGTAQKIENGTYSHTKHVGSFMGYAPADNPMLTMIVSIDEPKGAYYGGTVAAPVFQKVIEASLLYLGYDKEKKKASNRAMQDVDGLKGSAAQTSTINLIPAAPKR
ncbi:MAG: penicillin-binding protein [Candidatus Omnitrophica bacterium CG11_big_fil_rev_8_21_14_0_20_45_26]|uniref:Penicillin-binding protein n=1 Tax=Candidatus Abzuiibacterium crystallinum TaxID=1974748 RepID=A0A2H0LLX4_9BACT|nr:MAG: penicillin-binding protein [Candidatus Omnitrophica bacterium CG11_big_fil_rev_8_21_14_0_20_45_26]